MLDCFWMESLRSAILWERVMGSAILNESSIIILSAAGVTINNRWAGNPYSIRLIVKREKDLVLGKKSEHLIKNYL